MKIKIERLAVERLTHFKLMKLKHDLNDKRTMPCKELIQAFEGHIPSLVYLEISRHKQQNVKRP